LAIGEAGQISKAYPVGARRVGWYLSEIEVWLADRRKGISVEGEAHAEG